MEKEIQDIGWLESTKYYYPVPFWEKNEKNYVSGEKQHGGPGDVPNAPEIDY